MNYSYLNWVNYNDTTFSLLFSFRPIRWFSYRLDVLMLIKIVGAIKWCSEETIRLMVLYRGWLRRGTRYLCHRSAHCQPITADTRPNIVLDTVLLNSRDSSARDEGLNKGRLAWDLDELVPWLVGVDAAFARLMKQVSTSYVLQTFDHLIKFK